MRSSSLSIVGIGASAGGVAALEKFFAHVPADSGLSFVVVTHLNPTRRSELHSVIGYFSPIPVVVAEDGQVPEPNQVYVMPEAKMIFIEKGQLRLRDVEPSRPERRPIDFFFRSLAADLAEHAVGIILSGSDQDGAIGAREINAHGGIVMAQTTNGSAPGSPEMPNHAIATGTVDLALPAEEMAAALLRLVQVRQKIDLADAEPVGSEMAALREARGKIDAVLLRDSGHDFSGYKTKTFFRRVLRRMQIEGAETAEVYLEKLHSDSRAVVALAQDLLINVTDFFRDTEAFESLRQKVLLGLVAERDSKETVRIWVPACATGQEAYSLAMLLCEELEASAQSPQVQIFATDIDSTALDVARAGRYSEASLRHVNDERKVRFFEQAGDEYVVTKQLRKMCVFSPHNLIGDPPFSHMDLVSCRNLLIYLDNELQEKIIPILHYALKPGGHLFLGTSESIGDHGELFMPIDKKQRIFQRRTSEFSQPRLPMNYRGTSTKWGAHSRSNQRPTKSNISLRQSVEIHMLERHTPAHVVVDQEGHIIYYSTGTGKYLEAPRGAPSQQLMSLARRELQLDLQASLREAKETRKPVNRVRSLPEGSAVITTVEPLNFSGVPESNETLFVVLFQPVAESEAHPDVDVAPVSGESVVEHELLDTRERLLATIEEYETALEELKSSNEELASVNEEAQSSNEELEASKEEMESLNEELNTINTELSGKVEELNRANNDLRNLYESSQVATIFLSKSLTIRNFTPAASLFNIRKTDIGRPLSELACIVNYPEIQEDVALVFSTGQISERRLVSETNNEHYLVRLIPYREGGETITGVVVTLVDVTRIALAHQQQRVLVAELNHRVRNMLTVVSSLAAQCGEESGGESECHRTFMGRLHALARSYALVVSENWEDADLAELIGQEVEPYGADHVTFEGPDVRLQPDAALAFGMVVHELATNSVKYGALSEPSGAIEVSWSVKAEQLKLTWHESGGPKITQDPKEGFGFSLMRGQIEYKLEGRLTLDLSPEGLTATVLMPLPRTPEKGERVYAL